MFNGIDIVVQWCIDMPRREEATPMRVQKGNNFRNGPVVVVDDVCEVGHSLVSLVHGRGQGIGPSLIRGIDDVDGMLPTGRHVSRVIASCQRSPSYSERSSVTHETSVSSLAGTTMILSLILPPSGGG